MRIKMTGAMIALAGAITAAGACGGGSDTTAGTGGSGGTLGTASGGHGPQGGGGSTNSLSSTSSSTGQSSSSASSSGSMSGSGGASGCTELTLDDFMLFQAGEIGATFTPQIGAADPDLVDLQFYADTTGPFDLSAAPNDNYATCNECALVYEDATMSGVAKTYFQVSGQLTLDATSQPTSGPVNGSLSDVKLVEVTIDPNTFESTPVPGGGCLHIAAKTFDVSGGGGAGGGGTGGAGGSGGSGAGGGVPAGWTCDPTYYAAGDGCDCECGAYDPDCNDSSAQIFGCQTEQICAMDGTCQTPPPPAGWTCAAALYADGGTCDCNCGAEDLDCQYLLPVTGCSSGQFCGGNGVCVGESGGDTCAGATPITASGAYFGSLAGKTNDLDPTAAGCTTYDEPGPDVVYSIQLAANQTLTATAFQADDDVAVYVLNACTDPTTSCVAGADFGADGETDTVQYTATTAGTYYIVVDSFNPTNASDYSLVVSVQ